MNKNCISILICHPENKFKIEAFWFVFKTFCYQIFINFQETICSGGKTEKSQSMQLFDEIAMKLRLHKNGDSFLFPTANFIKNF